MQILRASRGFTLLEAIVAIVITGIIAGMVAVFIARPIEGYVDTVRRAGLTDVADLTLKRMAVEIRTAVPNSLYQTSSSDIEFIPASTGGRYCTDSDSGCNPLSFSTANDSFDILGPSIKLSPGDQIVIYNTGQSELNAYAGTNRRALSTSPGTITSLTISGAAFTYASPSNRFQLIPASGPIKYKCSGGTLRRYTGYGYTHTETGTGSLLADKVSACNFNYSAVSARNGLLVLSLTLSEAGESVTLHHEIHVDNMP